MREVRQRRSQLGWSDAFLVILGLHVAVPSRTVDGERLARGRVRRGDTAASHVAALLVPAPAPAASTAGSTSSTEQTEATGSPVSSAAPPSSASASTTASEPPPPPCIDGQILMGVCICDKGKSADATGHCVYTQCPSEHGGGDLPRSEHGSVHGVSPRDEAGQGRPLRALRAVTLRGPRSGH